MLPEVRKQVEAFKEEIGEEGWKRRLSYLKYVRLTIECKILDLEAWWACYRLEGLVVERMLIVDARAYWKKQLKRITREIAILNGRLEGRKPRENAITDAMIERAREYPLDQLVGVGRNGMAHCVAHDDKNPSMSCRNGFARCFACGFKGDPIDVFRKIHGVGFVEAVKALQ